MDPQKGAYSKARPSLELIGLRFVADARALKLALQAVPLAWRSRSVRRLLVELARVYPPGRAHRIARSQGLEIFGETPLATAARILQAAHVKPGQRLVELGCGPSRLSLLAAAHFGLNCLALDRIAAFVDRGNDLAARLGLQVQFQQVDLMAWQPPPADWVYIAGTDFPSSLRQRLGARLEGSQTKILSLTAPLNVPSHTPGLLGTYLLPWGREKVYLEIP